MEATRGNRYKITSTFVEKEFYNTPSIINIIHPENDILKLKCLLGILNSRLITWYHTKVHPKANAITSIPKILIKDIRKLPLPERLRENEIVFLVDQALNKRGKVKLLESSFCTLMKSKFDIKTISKKLQNWNELKFVEFLKELDKVLKRSAKENETKFIKLSLKEDAEWMTYFEEEKEKVKELKTEIDKIDREIDEMVYELYCLTKEEIEIVENN